MHNLLDAVFRKQLLREGMITEITFDHLHGRKFSDRLCVGALQLGVVVVIEVIQADELLVRPSIE